MDAESNQIDRIELKKKMQKKLIISLVNYKNNFPETIKIDHKNINLNIEFNYINK